MRIKLITLALALASSGVSSGQTYTISTVAGSGLPEGVPARSVSLGHVVGVATDAVGNVYFATVDYHVILRLDSTGVLTRVAGTPGRFGDYRGDNSPASNALLNWPADIAFDSVGSLYVADTANHRVRKISNGVITTIAGNGIRGFSGDNGPATSAQLYSPGGVAVDSAGNVYVLDGGNSRIRKISNGVITTVAGNGTEGYSGDGGPATSAKLAEPWGVATDEAGDLYIADAGNNRIRKVSNGVITSYAGNGTYGFSGDNGPAADAQLRSPVGVKVDPAGNLYIVDQGNNRIRKVSGGVITTVAGGGASSDIGDNGPATSAQLNGPTRVAIDSAGNMVIADCYNYRIRKVSGGVITTVAGNGSASYSGDNGPATIAQMNSPAGVAVDSAGNLYVADSDNHRIRKISGGVITTIAGGGRSWSDTGDNGLATNATLNSPRGVAIDSAGNLYIADSNNHRIRKVSGGVITTVAGDGTSGDGGDNGPATSAQLDFPIGVAVDSAANLYIADGGNHRIRRVSKGMISTVAGSGTEGYSGDEGPATEAQLFGPFGVAVDGLGSLYIADCGNYRVRKVSNGMITTVAGNGIAGYSGDGGPATTAQLDFPAGVAVDSTGNLYIADSQNFWIRRVSNGVITTIAGNGIRGFSGDNGPASSAQLDSPEGVAVGTAGDLYVADSGNNRIRRLAVAGASPFATVSAASFTPSVALAPGVIAAGYGTNLVSTIEIAPATGPLPTVLAQTSVTVRDSAGVERTAPLWFVSPTQINYYIPEGTALGLATITVVRDSLMIASGTLKIDHVAPGLFAMNADGQGVPAALAVFAKADGSQTWQYVFNTGCLPGSCQPVPLDLGVATDKVFLQLYGTGIRGRSSLAAVIAKMGGVDALVEYAGPVSGMVGLDQVNLRVPRSLMGRGQVDIILTMDSKTTNTVAVNFK